MSRPRDPAPWWRWSTYAASPADDRPPETCWDDDTDGPDPDPSMRPYQRTGNLRTMTASEPSVWNRPRPAVSRTMRARLARSHRKERDS